MNRHEVRETLTHELKILYRKLGDLHSVLEPEDVAYSDVYKVKSLMIKISNATNELEDIVYQS
ncbi:MAG: hypothetical protein V2I33_08555 [Kangiellaceae bacterium]|jgi:hypothetical protein|nr:hypothetical protein [Kangiellaceae bacterium]